MSTKGIFDSISKLTNSSVSMVSDFWKDVSSAVKSQVESIIKGMNFVTREEFNVVKKLVIQSKIEIEKLNGKIVTEEDVEKELMSKNESDTQKPNVSE